MKNLIINIIILLISFNIDVWGQSQTGWKEINVNSSIYDFQFINENTGYIATNDIPNNPLLIKKTTNRGYSWQVLGSINVNNFTPYGKPVGLNFIDENLGIVCCNNGIYKIDNNGIILKFQFFSNLYLCKVISTKIGSLSVFYIITTSNNDMLNIYESNLFKSTDSGNSWNRILHKSYSYYDYFFNDINFCKEDQSKIAICGNIVNKQNNSYTSYFANSNDGFSSINREMSLDEGSFCSVHIKPNLDVFILQRDAINVNPNFTHIYNREWNSTNTSTNLSQFASPIYWNSISNQKGMKFLDNSTGYILLSSMINNVNALRLHKTTNGGINWIVDFNDINDPVSFQYFSTLSSNKFDNMEQTYFSNLTNILYLKKLDNIYVNAKCDNINNLQTSINIDGNPYNTQYFYTLNSFINIQCNDDFQERIFYKWNDDYFCNQNHLFLIPSTQKVEANYKTKLKVDNPYAITNPTQTKALRDTTGTLHQIHESIGGIFYSRSTDGGSNFQREEVVNAGTQWNADYPYDVSSLENKCPSLSEIRNLNSGNLISFDYPYTNVSACWQHYNNYQQPHKMEIRVATRYTSSGGYSPDWYKYGINGNRNGVFTSFDVPSQNYISKPTIFVMSTFQDLNENYNHFVLVPHLEPSSNNGNKIVVTAKYKNSTYQGGMTNDILIADGNSEGIIDDYSVTAESTFNSNFSNGYKFHFIYRRGNKIIYQSLKIYLDVVTGGGTIINKLQLENEQDISAGDGQITRFSPDISLQNGLPIIAYRGNYYNQQIVSFENNEDNFQTISVFHKPIIVKYKEPNGNWSSYIMYDGLTEQENPNIEGSRNATAYLLNFKKNVSYYQFVKINGLSGYSCNPGVYSETDAKLVKGSYIGQFGTNSNPMLLTLSNPDNSLYTIGKQSFTINNTPVSDGFDNLDGTIIKDGINYSMTLGPIIASNTTFGFEDDVPPQTVHNPVEFNETMKSAVFSLSNGDTLILGSHGKYSFLDAEKFHPLKFHVSLINSETGIVHRELFSDTITIEDTVGLEFYRGFVIDKIEKGTENFYVQLFADTTNITDADYEMSASYADAQEQAQGNGKTLKSGGIKIFFEKPKLNTNPVNSIPKNFELSQNYPNPFNPTTKINYALPKSGLVTLKIYDLLGREIKTLVNEIKQAGNYTVSFNAMNLASGIYLYKIQSGDFVDVKKMTLIK